MSRPKLLDLFCGAGGCSVGYRWIDAFQGLGPIARWRQYQASPASRAIRSAEMYGIRVEERAALIRRQVAHIRATCNHAEDGAA